MDYLTKANLDGEKGQSLLSRLTGSKTCRITLAIIEPGHSSPSGLHTHEVDQICYILKGELNFEIADEEYEQGAEIKTREFRATENTLVTVPAGVPHRNFNSTSEAEYHLDILIPEPLPDRPGSFTVREDPKSPG